MPTLIITPDMRADTWLGATGWASGSHTCIGTMPAFEPKPTAARRKQVDARCGAAVIAAGMASKSIVPARSPRRKKRAKRKRVPRWVATR